MPRVGREQSGTGIYHVMLRGINRQKKTSLAMSWKTGEQDCQTDNIYSSNQLCFGG